MAQPPAGDARRGRRRLRQRLVFGGLAFALVLGTLEVTARASGFGDPERFGGSRLKYQQVFPPLFVPAADGRGYRPRDPRLVDRSFPRGDARPLRVFVFGGSAVAGLGYSENASFSRALERRLRARVAESYVVNVGVVALSSRQIRRMVDDVARLREGEGDGATDVFVLHVGNNEFLELHARRFAETAGGQPLAVRLDEALETSRFYLGVKQVVVKARNRALSPRSFATDDLRLPESRLVEVVKIGDEDRAQVVARHRENLRDCVERVRAAGGHPLLMTVATNLEWAGKEDPAGGWLAEAVGGALPDAPDARTAALQAALERVDAALATERPALERWKDLLCRAHVLRALGRGREARDAFVAAKDGDPRLRRCLSAMNDGVRALGAELGVTVVDGERALEATAPDGIVGFEDLYDYVHFTPLGAERLAGAIDEALVAAGLVAPFDDASAWVGRRAAALAQATRDTLDVREWIGWDEDRGVLGDRDLWKYEEQRRELDERIASGVATPVEQVWAANGYALEVGGEQRARELYAAAVARDPALEPAVRANLAWLDERAR